jgi:electron transfer flavoprotein alpha/beta subunit
MMGILQARDKQVHQWGLDEIGLETEDVGLSGSPSRVVGSVTLQSMRQGEILQGEDEVVVRQLVQNLRKMGML